MAIEYYPPGAFYFTVALYGTAVSLATDIDASFQEVSGIRSELGVEEVVEGGENRFVHRLPRAATYPNLVLKRGVATQQSFLVEWAGQTIGSRLALPIVTQNLVVSLLDQLATPLVVWGFVNAYPVRWDVSPLISLDNKVLIETLELSYDYFERFNLGSTLSAAVKAAQVVARL